MYDKHIHSHFKEGALIKNIYSKPFKRIPQCICKQNTRRATTNNKKKGEISWVLDNNSGSDNDDDDIVDYRKDNSDYNDDDSDGDDDDDDDDNNKQSKRMFFFFSLLLLKNASTTLFQHFFLFHFYKCVPADPHTIGGVCVWLEKNENETKTVDFLFKNHVITHLSPALRRVLYCRCVFVAMI